MSGNGIKLCCWLLGSVAELGIAGTGVVPGTAGEKPGGVGEKPGGTSIKSGEAGVNTGTAGDRAGEAYGKPEEEPLKEADTAFTPFVALQLIVTVVSSKSK